MNPLTPVKTIFCKSEKSSVGNKYLRPKTAITAAPDINADLPRVGRSFLVSVPLGEETFDFFIYSLYHTLYDIINYIR